MPRHPPVVQPGDVIAAKYRVERVLGEGGMGLVVAARHTDLDRLFAIKLLLGDAATDSQAVERFLREARSASQLVSQHVVRVSDVGRLEQGTPYMVLEHLDGQDLAAVLRERGPLPLAEVCDHVLQVCEALAEAHSLGIVHRDIKPSNLFLTRGSDGSPLIKVLDFGISKLLVASPVDGALTTTSSVLGSPRYMSPEQLRQPRDVDTRTDIWALGVVLHELLTGHSPFTGETLAGIAFSIMTETPEPVSRLRPELPVGIDLIIARCLEKTAAARWVSVGELARALEPFSAVHGSSRADRILRIRGSDAPANLATDETFAVARESLPGHSPGAVPGPPSMLPALPRTTNAPSTTSQPATASPATARAPSLSQSSPDASRRPSTPPGSADSLAQVAGLPGGPSRSSLFFAAGAALLCVTVIGGVLLWQDRPPPATPAALAASAVGRAPAPSATTHSPLATVEPSATALASAPATSAPPASASIVRAPVGKATGASPVTAPVKGTTKTDRNDGMDARK